MVPHNERTGFLQKGKLVSSNEADSLGELYRQLNKVADELTQKLGRPVSMREALLQLIESMKLEPSDFSWSWRINESKSTIKHP